MKDVLNPRHRAALERFAGNPRPAKVLLAFDYDGVLAPLVKDPAGARMRPSTRKLLAALGRHYRTAVVSGRAWKDTARFVEGTVRHVVGNHGFELERPVPVPRTVVAQVQRWREQLERELAGVPGVFFEDKRSTLAIHYGLSRTWRKSGRAVFEAANRLEDTRLVGGKKVLNVLPRDFPTKGDAIRTLLAKLHLEAALYAGDDVTDEDAFALGPPLVFGVHVGPGASLAEWRLRSQDDIERLFELLLEVRERPARGRRARRAPGELVGGEK
jgi:trehalose 6-phosphate phosphatase